MSSAVPAGDAALFDEVIAKLRRSPRMLPTKLFYDARGAALFEQITTLPEYYPTRVESEILRAHGTDIAAWVGADAQVIEFGSGSGEKTRLLLEQLETPAEYLPIDIAASQLQAFASSLRAEFPGLQVHPIVADYTRGLRMPASPDAPGRTVVFFPGSTIGNFEPDEARAFLRRAAQLAGSGAGLLIGVDLKKDVAILERAYNDAAGVTAAFNLNILQHVNRLFAGTFDVSAFRHHAFYSAEHGRVEMHLISVPAQRVTLTAQDGRRETIELDAGEHIVTEYSYKYSVEEFVALADAAGFTWRRTWTDGARMFAELAFDVRGA